MQFPHGVFLSHLTFRVRHGIHALDLSTRPLGRPGTGPKGWMGRITGSGMSVFVIVSGCGGDREIQVRAVPYIITSLL